MEEKELLLRHMEDLAARAHRTGSAASKFLTPAQAAQAAGQRALAGVELSFDGGFRDAERVRAVFLNSDWGACDRTQVLTALQITYRPQDTLGHRDILGALMALGIERDTVGDIAGAGEGAAALVCLPELGGYITENLTRAGRVGVSVSEIGLDELPDSREEPAEKNDTVASLRLDAVLCAAFDLSRAKAAELITAGRVSVDHGLCLQPSRELAAGALLSVRALGRASLLEVGGMSRKGRIFVRLGIYGR